MSVMSFTVQRPRQLSEVVKVEVHPELSRESGPALAGVALDLGSVVAKVGGKFVLFDPTKTDGSEDAYGVSQNVVEAGAADVQIVISRRFTVVSASGLRWPAGITTPQLAAAIAQLDANALVVRNY